MGKFIAGATVCLLLGALFLAGCSENPTGTTVGSSATDEGKLAAKPSTYGNCLSMPVIFAEGHGMTGDLAANATGLRGAPGTELFIEPYNTTLIDGYPVYRNPSVNEWSADWADGTTWGEIMVEADWADNLTRQTWTDKSKVRVEMVLFAAVDPVLHPLTGYNMFSLGGTQLNEVFVTNTTKYTASLATVYSNVARLKIVKLAAKGGPAVLEVYDSACYEGYFIDGPVDAYTGEVNMSGKCIYGYNWDVGSVPLTDKAGWYRLTFSFDPSAAYTDINGVPQNYGRNTRIATLNPGDLVGTSEPEVVLYPPTIGADGYSTDLEIEIKAGTGGGKRPGKQ